MTDHAAQARRSLPLRASALAACALFALQGCAGPEVVEPRWGRSDVLPPAEFLADQATLVRTRDQAHERYVLVRVHNLDDQGGEIVGIRGTVTLSDASAAQVCGVKLESAVGATVPLEMQAEVSGNRFAIRGFEPLGRNESFLLWIDICKPPAGWYRVELVAEY